MTERLCSDCDGLVALAPNDDGVGWDALDSELDLMCVVCGAALSLGGLLLGEILALEDSEQVA